MTCPGFSGLAGLAVVANGFKRAHTVDGQWPCHPVLEYLVADRRVGDKGLGRQLGRHVLQEVCTDADEVIVEAGRERVDAVRFWTEHLQCALAPDSEQTVAKVVRLRWSPVDNDRSPAPATAGRSAVVSADAGVECPATAPTADAR